MSRSRRLAAVPGRVRRRKTSRKCSRRTSKTARLARRSRRPGRRRRVMARAREGPGTESVGVGAGPEANHRRAQGRGRARSGRDRVRVRRRLARSSVSSTRPMRQGELGKLASYRVLEVLGEGRHGGRPQGDRPCAAPDGRHQGAGASACHQQLGPAAVRPGGHGRRRPSATSTSWRFTRWTSGRACPTW